ncbi:MAG: 5-formyltetrahydrofolate cyclo-ligase [Acidobacteriota bacterium]|nr:5-formyltetrahydrofolate cyclo-ligase [Acidobacteriota bacterium]
MTKNELRKIYLAKQKNISLIERREKSRQISNRFFEIFNLNRINFLHCFLPIEKFNEIDTKIIFQNVWREFANVETLVPRVNFQTNTIENVKFASKTALIKNIWKIDEPAQSDSVETKEIDLVLVPLLCFDARGFRVGYGKGFYDRFLKDCRADCLKIGLSYFAPVAEISDARDFDVKLDFCITPEKLVSRKS